MTVDRVGWEMGYRAPLHPKSTSGVNSCTFFMVMSRELGQTVSTRSIGDGVFRVRVEVVDGRRARVKGLKNDTRET